ncbi:hypothetical protein V6N12_069145 [Hibiscus sabdariffa]|uniref:Uncharacterized protein n=1 Tax=Hibiscus sabdariffa TaxID=183260 RepID=A0ABR2FD22_9ROSI
MKKIRRLCGFSNGIDVSPNGRSGELSLRWKDSISISLRSFSKHHVDVIVDEDSNGNSWRFTGFYGAQELGNRSDSWNLDY